MFQREVNIPGFVGYAVNLLRLREEHEYLRYSVLWIVFKNLMIFETDEDRLSYAATLPFNEIEEFWAISLDFYDYPALNERYPQLLTSRNDQFELSETIPTSQRVAQLNKSICNVKHSYTVIRYT